MIFCHVALVVKNSSTSYPYSFYAYSHSPNNYNYLFPESPEDYGIPTTLMFANGTELPAFGCIDISTIDDTELEGEHGFSLHVYNTSIGPDSLVAIINDSSTVIVTIDDNEGEVINVYYCSCTVNDHC